MGMNQTNQEPPLSWDEAKGYLDRLDPDLLESVLSVDYSNPDEFICCFLKPFANSWHASWTSSAPVGKSMRKSVPNGWKCSRK